MLHCNYTILSGLHYFITKRIVAYVLYYWTSSPQTETSSAHLQAGRFDIDKGINISQHQL